MATDPMAPAPAPRRRSTLWRLWPVAMLFVPGCPSALAADTANLAVIVNGRNPVTTLSPGQVAAIYSQHMRHWSELGGADKTIVRVVKEAGTTPATVLARSLGQPAANESGAHVVNADLAAILFVAIDPYAIAYVSAAEAERLIQEGVRIKVVWQIGPAHNPRP